METDYLIIGQGISGTWLSHYLLSEGRHVIVIDDHMPATASRVASGVINPITGMRLVRSWIADRLLPFALDAYRALSHQLGIAVVEQTAILDFHFTRGSQELFAAKMQEEQEYLHQGNDTEWTSLFRFNYGVGSIAPVLLVHMHALQNAWRHKLEDNNLLLPEHFSWSDCIIAPDNVVYKDIIAQKIILCDGAAALHDPYFGMLPWSQDKGEALIAAIPGLPQGHIYRQQGINIVPWHDGLFWVGATHDWQFRDMEPTAAFRKRTEEQLDYWLKLPYTIVGHLVARRPVNFERKPFIGMHPVHRSIGICNGMGTKGCALAPYFAQQFARHLVYDEPLMPEVDIKRFAKVLSR